MYKFLKAVLIGLCAGLLADVIQTGIENKAKGKTLLGKQRRKTVRDWQGNVVLGSDDYKVEA